MATFGLADEGRAGLTTDLEATGNGSVIAILKRIRTLLGGAGSMRITDGNSTATVRDLPANDALNVAIVDSAGNQITSFGGSTPTLTFTAVGVASSGNNTIVTNSNAGLKTRVYGMFLMSASAQNIYFTSDTGGTVIIGNATNKIALAANQGFVLPTSSGGWAETVANQDLVLNLSAAASVAGVVMTAEV